MDPEGDHIGGDCRIGRGIGLAQVHGSSVGRPIMKHATSLITLAVATLAAAPASAEHTYGSDIAIRVLAEDVEYFAGQVYREGTYLARSHDRGDYKAMRDLEELDRAARHLNRQIQRYYSDPLHTANDFERLRVAFYRAHDSAPYLYGYRRLENDIYALADAMRRLEYAFADFGYRYRRPFPRLRFHIDLGVPYHHPRGHRVYRKPYGHGYRWYSSIDLHYYSKPRHGKRYYHRDKGHHYKYGRGDYYKRGKGHHYKRGKGHYKNRGKGHAKHGDRYYRQDGHRGGNSHHKHDNDEARRRGSASRTRPRR